MNCPVCTTENLLMSERSGIEIDYCPKCRGVWLDRGELDKIIERNAQSVGEESVQRDAPTRNDVRQSDDYQSQSHDHHGYYDDHHDSFKLKKRRGGFMEDLFDFGD